MHRCSWIVKKTLMKVVDDKFGEMYAKFYNIEGKKLDLNMLLYLKMNLGADQ